MVDGSQEAAARVLRHKAEKAGSQCKSHPTEAAQFFIPALSELCCRLCREKGEAYWYHECLSCQTATEQAQARVRQKLDKLQRVDAGVSQLLNDLDRKASRLKQNTVRIEADVVTKLEKLAYAVGVRKVDMIKMAKKNEAEAKKLIARQ